MVGFSLLTWLNYAVGLVSVPIATRLYDPDQLGRINMFKTVEMLLAALCCLGLDQAFVRFYRERPCNRSREYLLTACIMPALSLAVVVSGAMLVFWRWVSGAVVGEQRFVVAVLMGFFLVGTTVGRFLAQLYRMRGDVKWYTIQGLAVGLTSTTLFLIAAIFSRSYLPALIVMAGLAVLWMVIFTLTHRKAFDLRPTRPEAPFVREVALYALPLVPATLLFLGNNSISQIILRAMDGFASIGIYSAAVTLATTVNVVQAGFSAAWTPYVLEHYKDEQTNFWPVHRMVAFVLTFFVLICTMLQGVIVLLLGPQYREAGVLFPFLFLSPVCFTLVSTIGLGFNIAKKTYWTIVTAGVAVIVTGAGCFMLIPKLGMIGAALGVAVGGVAYTVVATAISEHYYRVAKHYGYVVLTLGASVGAAVINWLLYDNVLWRSVVLAALFVVCAVLFRQQLALSVRLGRTGLRRILSHGRRVKQPA